MAHVELRKHDKAGLLEKLMEECVKAIENGNCSSCDRCPIWQRVRKSVEEEAVEELWSNEEGKIVGV